MDDCGFRLSRASVISAFDIGVETLRALEDEGAIRFGADDRIDVRHFAQAFAEKALSIVKDAHRSVLTTTGALAEMSTTLNETASLVADDQNGARALRELISEHAAIVGGLYTELLNTVGRFVHEDVLKSIGERRHEDRD